MEEKNSMTAVEDPSKTEVSFKVSGVTFENRQEILERFYRDWREGMSYSVELRQENDNPFDANAIGIWLEVDGKLEKVGFVPKGINVVVKEEIDKIKSSNVGTIGITPKGTIGLTVVCRF